MAAWFIRIGATDEKVHLKFYRDLAENHSAIIIGYALDRKFALQNHDFTRTRSISDIENSFEKCEQRRGLNLTQKKINWRSELIHRFISEVKKNQMVISPYGNISGFFRIGIIKSECRILKKIVSQSTITNMLQNQHSGIDAFQRPPEFKPARKVEWKYVNVPLNRLPSPLNTAMANHSKPSMWATTNKLNATGTVNMSSLQSFAVNGGIQGNFTL